MKEIDGNATNIRDLLTNERFGIDYFQRDYRWEKKHVEELVNDLSQAFLDTHSESNALAQVQNYDIYFLGSITTSKKDGQRSIVDGQQRLTTITLLLIYLYHKVENDSLKNTIAPLVSCYKFGKHSYNLNIPKRNKCMDHLFKGSELSPKAAKKPSVPNILERYKDIESVFPEEIQQSQILEFFIEWLLERVYLVETTTDSEADAYTIFESMNDRGLSLTPAEMLRGYLLAKINNSKRQRTALTTWDNRMSELQGIGHGEGAHAIRAWLRSQYAESIRQGGRGSGPGDFDLIGTEFHRWVRDRQDDIGLRGSEAFADFVEHDFDFYAKWYRVIRRASNGLTKGLEPFVYVARTGFTFTLQDMPALAPLSIKDDPVMCERKLRTVATAIDCILYRRIWNSRSNSHSRMRVYMFQSLTRQIRQVSIDELADTLCNLVESYHEQFVENDFSLNQMNRPKIHQMIARITDYVETESDMDSSYESLRRRGSGKGNYQIEHVLSESHRDGFDDFDYHRNKIGALVLLPGPVNASIGDMRFGKKRKHYLKENLLAASLHDLAYENAPGFRRFRNTFKEDTGLDFGPYGEFDVDAISERQELYRQLAERIWSTDSIREAAGIA